MKYDAYSKAKVQAYTNLRSYMNGWKLKAIDARHIDKEFDLLSTVDRYAIALHTLDCSSCFHEWYEKELITYLTFPVLLEFLSQLLDRASSVQEVKFLAEIRGVIKTAYRLLQDSDNTGKNEPENELAKLWEVYSIASESFLTVADKWFEEYVGS